MNEIGNGIYISPNFDEDAYRAAVADAERTLWAKFTAAIRDILETPLNDNDRAGL